jgi:hypothetical protein
LNSLLKYFNYHLAAHLTILGLTYSPHSKLAPRIPVVGVPFLEIQFLFVGFLMRLFAQMLLSRIFPRVRGHLGRPQ